MSSAVVLFIARALLLVLLYGFLLIVVRTLRRDLRAATQPVVSSVAVAHASNGRSVATPTLLLELERAGQTQFAVGDRFPLRDPMVLGRAPECDLVLQDDWISAQHLRLRRRGNDWLVEDLGTTNGSRLNGTPLHTARSVSLGDTLDLGRIVLKLVEA